MTSEEAADRLPYIAERVADRLAYDGYIDIGDDHVGELAEVLRSFIAGIPTQALEGDAEPDG